MAKPTSKHRPEYAKFIGTQAGFAGIKRYHFEIPSKSQPDHSYTYLVNDDGTAPYCSCGEEAPFTMAGAFSHGCYLCNPAVAVEMAERGRKCAAGEPVPVGF